MTRPLIVLTVLTALSCSSTPPAGACSADSDCTGMGPRCLSHKCYQKQCATKSCGLAQVCVADACIDEQCTEKTCDVGSTCLKGDCLSTKCGTVNCGDGRVCANDVCIDASCYGVVCPAGQTCSAGSCSGGDAGVTCGGTTCTGGTVCDMAVMTCVEPSCVGVRCDAGTCSGGQCSTPTCGGVTCTGGKVCDTAVMACVEPSCVGVRCDGGTCSGGTCVDTCTLSCAAPCPPCADGRTCAGHAECQSHLCQGTTCTACDMAANACPNGGLCQAGICRSGVLGPCSSALDCKPGQGLTCEDMTCRFGADAGCTMDSECIKALACENLVCQRAKCILQLTETQNVPLLGVAFGAQATHISAAGEVYVTHGQWDSNYTTNDFRRFRVAPMMAPVEQLPTTAPLLAFDVNSPIAEGHSDSPGSAQGTFATAPMQKFWWYPGGGAFDGLKALEIQFAGFDNDVSGNLSNGGRFAKCGNTFYFVANAIATGNKVMLAYTPPQPIGSGTMAQVMMQHTVRRDSWPLARVADINCTANFVYVLGDQGNQLQVVKLSTTNLATIDTWAVPQAGIQSASIGSWNLALVDDHLQFLVPANGPSWQLLDGVPLKLSSIASLTSTYYSAMSSGSDGFVTFDENGAPAMNSQVRRWARRRMNGTTPALTLDCNYQ